MRLEVLLNLLIRRMRHTARQFARSKGKVGNLALFRNSRGIPRRVLLEESFQLRVRGIDRLAQVLRGKNRVVELDLDAFLAIGVAHFLVAHRHSARDKRLQPVYDDTLPDTFLKLRNRLIEAIGDQRGVCVLADELPIREKYLAGLAGVQDTVHVVVRHVYAQLIRLCQQNLRLHQSLALALLKVT